MSPYRRAALLFIRLIAFSLMLFSSLYLGAYFFASRAGNRPDDGIFLMSLKTLPLLIGLFLMIRSSAIAKKLTEDIEE